MNQNKDEGSGMKDESDGVAEGWLIDSIRGNVCPIKPTDPPAALIRSISTFPFRFIPYP